MTDYISREAAKENIGALLRQMFQECEDTRLKWAYQDGVKDAIIRLLAIPAALMTDEMWEQYIEWCKTDDGKKYLKGGSEYREEQT